MNQMSGQKSLKADSEHIQWKERKKQSKQLLVWSGQFDGFVKILGTFQHYKLGD